MPRLLSLKTTLLVGAVAMITKVFLSRKRKEIFDSFDTEQGVLITGGTTGLGLEMAKLFAKHDKTELVLLCYKRCLKNPNTTFSGEFQTKVTQYELDLSKTETLAEKIRKIYRKHPKLGILVNNAGMVEIGPFFALPNLDVFERTMRVNFHAPVTLTKVFMEEYKKGHIAFITSICGHIHSFALTSYVASKHALTGFQKTLNLENKEQGLPFTTTNISPYTFNSTLFKKEVQDLINKSPLPSQDIRDVAWAAYEAIKSKDEEVIFPWYWKIIAVFSNALPRSWEDSINWLYI